MPPEDNFRRDRDPTTRRNASILGVLVATALAALAGGFWLTRQSPHGPRPVVAVTATPAPVPPTPPSLVPTPVPHVPIVGSGFSATYDPSTHQLMVFGGIDSYDQTWLWDGHRWSLARPPVSPPGRFRAAAAYDPLTRRVMLYGGRLGPGEVVDDTWSWDGGTWQELDSGTGSPPAGEGAVMAWDDSLKEMLLVGGSGASGDRTWIWKDTRWVRAPGVDVPTGTFFVGLAFDPATGSLLGASCCSPGAGAIATWAWHATGWHRLSTRAQPAFAATLALGPAGGRPLLLADPAFAAGREMWSWSGQDWTLLTGARLPLFPEGEVTDIDSGQVAILGSVAEPVQGSPQPIHVWSWTGSVWRQLG